jgi:hypothetical protein
MADKKFPEEDFVKAAMCSFFKEDLISVAMGTKHGVDIAAVYPAGSKKKLFIEVKGHKENSWGSAQAQFDRGYAILPQFETGTKYIFLEKERGFLPENSKKQKRTTIPPQREIPDYVGLALPATREIMRHAERFIVRMAENGDGLWLVGNDGVVHCILKPKIIDVNRRRSAEWRTPKQYGTKLSIENFRAHCSRLVRK